MSARPNRSAFVKSPWQFEIRDNPIGDPGAGEMLVEIAACGVCGTDYHLADRTANEWQLFGHEIAGTVIAVGEGVTRFQVGDRVALNTASPCGKCAVCSPSPYGRGRPELCPTPATYWGGAHMGFGEFIVTPHQCAVRIPDSMPFEVASLAEPMDVSIDLVETAGVGPGDNVLVIGPGPLGLGALFVARRAGASHIALAGFSSSVARMECGRALGADEIIEVDKTPIAEHDFGSHRPDKVLVTSPPQTLLQAIEVAAFGATIAYIGIAWGPGAEVTFDADSFHFRKLSLRSSFASPDTQIAKSIRLLETSPELGRELISHRFPLDEIGKAMIMARDDKKRTVRAVKKMVMLKG